MEAAGAQKALTASIVLSVQWVGLQVKSAPEATLLLPRVVSRAIRQAWSCDERPASS